VRAAVKPAAQAALVFQGLGLAYTVHKGEYAQAFLLVGSMMATYLSTREEEAKEADKVLAAKGAKGGTETLSDYVAGLRRSAGMAQA
jgi:hypothetical protein